MYKIIGTDQKEYGPVTASEVAQWISEGRADGRTAARLEPDGEWKPLAAFPEFAAALASGPFAHTAPPPASGPLPPLSVEELLARDYDLDIGSCLSRSWELVKGNFGPVVGITFLVLVITGVINQGISLVSRSATETITQNLIVKHEFTTDGLWLIALTWGLSAPVQVVFVAGLYKYYLKLIRGEEAGVADAFSGITTALWPLILLSIVMTGLIFVGFLFCILPGIYLSVALWFAIPLVVDKQLGVWEAMQLSLKMVNKHWFVVFAAGLVAGLVGACGLCALCIGVLVTMPISYGMLMYAYEDIFSRRTG